MTPPTVFLFDLDGTLVRTGGAGRVALVRAFDELLGRPDAFDSFGFGGRTDRAIVRQGLQAVGAPATDVGIDAVLTRYLHHLEQVVSEAAGYRICPGVPELLSALAGRPGAAVGLGTGNVERGARIKLEPGGLNPSFPFGGFGCDHEDRTELLRAGARRGLARLRHPPEGCRLVIVGDTPRDVAASRSLGAFSVAVATGFATRAELLQARPDLLLDDLAGDAVDRIVAGGISSTPWRDHGDP